MANFARAAEAKPSILEAGSTVMPPRCAYTSPRSSPFSPSAAALRTGASSSGGAAPVNSTHAGAFHQPAFTSADLPRFSSSWERERAQQPRSRPLGASGLSSCTPEADPRLQVVHLTKTSTGTPQLLTPNGERLDDHLASRATHLAERHQQINDLTAENAELHVQLADLTAAHEKLLTIFEADNERIAALVDQLTALQRENQVLRKRCVAEDQLPGGLLSAGGGSQYGRSADLVDAGAPALSPQYEGALVGPRGAHHLGEGGFECCV